MLIVGCSFLQKSSIYCRQNILKVMTLGRVQLLEFLELFYDCIKDILTQKQFNKCNEILFYMWKLNFVHKG